MHKFLFLLLIIGFTKSVQAENSTKDIFNDSIVTPIIIAPHETQVESYSTKGIPILKLLLKTQHQYHTSSYLILYTSHLKKKTLTVILDSLKTDGPLHTSPGPAIAFIDLPKNINSLTLIHGKKEDHYEVIINKEYIELKKKKGSFSSLKYSKLYKYPKNSYIIKSNNSEGTNSFSALLSMLDAQSHKLKDDGINPFNQNFSWYPREESPIIYTYKNKKQFKKVMNWLKLNSTSEMQAFVLTWKNEYIPLPEAE